MDTPAPEKPLFNPHEVRFFNGPNGMEIETHTAVVPGDDGVQATTVLFRGTVNTPAGPLQLRVPLTAWLDRVKPDWRTLSPEQAVFMVCQHTDEFPTAPEVKAAAGALARAQFQAMKARHDAMSHQLVGADGAPMKPDAKPKLVLPG